uniref:Si:dkey-19b23.7 n=1 Tax=Echeneis naucrates TaxID=173247 RepID=A0A665WKQ2_ECHNA
VMIAGEGEEPQDETRGAKQSFGKMALLFSLQGFKYFQPWLRGKEELLLTVVNEDLVSFSVGGKKKSGRSHNLTSAPSPWDWLISPFVFRDPSSEEHLLPASPSEREIAVPEVNCTLFLLAGYVKYGRPYAWIRSNHERLVNIGGTDSLVRDTPMKLKSISDWQTRGIRVWDIVSELVCLCTIPSPSNPFALDMRYIQSLPFPDRFLVTGALLNFLEMYVVYGNRDELHYDKVVEEVKPLRRLHVQSLLELQRCRDTSRLSCSPAAQDSSEEE